MNRITVDNTVKVQLEGVAEPVAVYDLAGRMLGHFFPSGPSDDCPYSAEELEGMRTEIGGRPLSEIWRALGAK